MRDESQKAGWGPAEYFPLCGFGRSKGYTLPPELQPKSVKVGKRRVIIEPPAQYLARLATMQAEKIAA